MAIAVSVSWTDSTSAPQQEDLEGAQKKSKSQGENFKPGE
jgi:hypothetical protein